MLVTYSVSADTIDRAIDIARSRARADGWQECTVVRSMSTGPRSFEIEVLVSRRR
jgi:hypothetical protein